MSTTANLSLPLILPSQAQKHVTHNEALLMLDAIVQLCVRSRNNNDVPENNVDGVQFLIGENPEGLFQDHPLEIAVLQNNAWVFYKPKAGWLAWIESENLLVVFDGENWTSVESSAQDTLPQLGINASADPHNRLSINATGSLFSHDGNSHRLAINKANELDSASLIFQTGFSGRAEIGTTGDDKLHFRTSTDGEAFLDSLTIDTNGRCGHGIDTPEHSFHVEKSESDKNTAAFAMTGYALSGTPTDTEGVGLYLTGNSGPTNRQFSILTTDTQTGLRIGIFGNNTIMDALSNGGTRRDLILGNNTNGIAIAQAHAAVPSQLTVSNHAGNANKVCHYIGGHANQVGDYLRISSWLFNGAADQGDVLNIRGADYRAEFGGPVKLPSFTTATVPSASSSESGSQIYLSDGDGGAPCLAVSDGATWRRISLGTTISAT